MTQHRLIIVEGLPGTGKSTTAALIAQALQRQGQPVVCLDEGDPNHPADYADYDFPDFPTERRLILDKWRSFVSQADSGTVYVFNCIFLQNPMCETMMRFGLDLETNRAYIQEIAQIIQPLHPLILYLTLPNVKTTVDQVLAERGDDWLQAVIGYHTTQGYGQQMGLTGYDGYIRCLEERKRREMDILRSLDLEWYELRKQKVDDEIAGLLEDAGY